MLLPFKFGVCTPYPYQNLVTTQLVKSSILVRWGSPTPAHYLDSDWRMARQGSGSISRLDWWTAIVVSANQIAALFSLKAVTPDPRIPHNRTRQKVLPSPNTKFISGHSHRSLKQQNIPRTYVSNPNLVNTSLIVTGKRTN